MKPEQQFPTINELTGKGSLSIEGAVSDAVTNPFLSTTSAFPELINNLVKLYNGNKPLFTKEMLAIKTNSPYQYEKVVKALKKRGISIADKHKSADGEYFGVEGKSDFDVELIVDINPLLTSPGDNANFKSATGDTYFSAKGKKKKKSARRVLAGILTGGASELVENKKAGRVAGAIASGGVSEITRKQAEDVKKKIKKIEADRAAKGKKSLIPKGKLGDIAKKRLGIKKSVTPVETAKILGTLKSQVKFKNNSELATKIARNIFNSRLLKNQMLTQQGAPTISMYTYPSMAEQKEAATQYVYEYPAQAQQVYDYVQQYPEAQEYIPQPYEADQYGAQQEVMNYYEQEVIDLSPEYVDEVQQAADIEPADVEEQDAESTDLGSQDTDANGEQVVKEELGSDYESFDSEISPGLNSDALNILRFDGVYENFDADTFIEKEKAFFSITPDEEAAKEKAKEEKKAAKKKAKEEAKAAKAAKAPNTEKGKKAADVFKNIGNALLQNAGGILTSIANGSNGSNLGDTSGEGGSYDNSGDGSPEDKTGQTVLIIGGVAVGLGIVAFLAYKAFAPKSGK